MDGHAPYRLPELVRHPRSRIGIMRSCRQDAHGLLRGKKNSCGAKGIIGEAASWRVIDDTAFGRESRCSYLRLKLPSGISTQVVVPSVSPAALLRGTAPTVFVETPSSATLFKPVSDPEISGPPTSGTVPAVSGIAAGGAAAAGGGPQPRAAPVLRQRPPCTNSKLRRQRKAN